MCSMCSYIPTCCQPMCVGFGCFGFFCIGDQAVILGLGAGRAVVSLPLLELLGTFLWHTVAAGSLLFDVLSCHRWLTISFYLAAFLPSSSCLALLLSIPGGLTTFLNDRRQGRLGQRHTIHKAMLINYICTYDRTYDDPLGKCQKCTSFD